MATEDKDALVRRFLKTARNRRMDPRNPEYIDEYEKFTVQEDKEVDPPDEETAPEVPEEGNSPL